MTDLQRFIVVYVPDDAPDPSLACDVCKEVLCSVELDDSLAVLVSVAAAHRCST